MNKSKLIISSACASIITIIFVVIITIWAELSVSLKEWLKNFSGHHWTSKSIFSILLYLVAMTLSYLGFYNTSEVLLRKMLIFLLIFTVLGIITITAFY